MHDTVRWLQTLEISGKIKPLVGHNSQGKPAPLALFALCCPFGPLPLPDVPWRDCTFKTKHAMDLTLLSMDARYVNYTAFLPAIFRVAKEKQAVDCY